MKTIIISISLILSVQAFSAEDYCPSEALLKLSQDFIAKSDKMGDVLKSIKKLEAVTFDYETSNQIMLIRRNLEDDIKRNEITFISIVKTCKYFFEESPKPNFSSTLWKIHNVERQPNAADFKKSIF
jgi:hypothetical protein